MKTLICTTFFDVNGGIERYVKPLSDLITSYLEYTDFDILILTNVPEKLNHIDSKRIFIIDYYSNFSEPHISANKFNMHLKRTAIRLGSQKDYEIIYHHDCDCYITGWDQYSYLEFIKKDYDIIFPNSSHPQLGGLRANYKHFQDKIDKEFVDLYYPELDLAPNASETRIIFKNNSKLKVFLDFWDQISEKNKDFFTYFDSVYFGTSAIHSKMKITHVNDQVKFSTFGRINHKPRILDYYGNTVQES